MRFCEELSYQELVSSDRVIVYGAGVFGLRFLEACKRYFYDKEKIIVWDMKYDEIKTVLGFRVSKPDLNKINDCENVVVVIALSSEKKQLIADLVQIFRQNGYQKIVTADNVIHKYLNAESDIVVKNAGLKNRKKSNRKNNCKNNLKNNCKNNLKNDCLSKNIIYLLHDSFGGSVKTTEDLIKYFAQKHNVFLLISNGCRLILYQWHNGVLDIEEKWDLTNHWHISKLYDDEYAKIYHEIYTKYHIDIIHCCHLFMHSFDAVKVGHKLKKAIFLSIHDFYYLCPSINLVNDKGDYCKIQCLECPSFKMNQAAPAWVSHTWQREVRALFKYIAHFFAPSLYAIEIYNAIYPEISARNALIEHGMEAYQKADNSYFAENTDKIKIIVPGNLTYNKGGDYIRQLYENDVDKKLEFHHLGAIDDEYRPYVLSHGKYLRAELPDYIKKIKPLFIAILSVCPETYSYTLSEGLGLGIPCLVTDIGALGERGKKGGCIIAGINEPKQTAERIISLSQDKEAYENLFIEAKNIKLKTINEMGEAYEKIIERHGLLHEPKTAGSI